MKKILISLFLLSASVLSFAQAVPFVQIPSDARALSLGGTGLVQSAGAYAWDNNMAVSALGEQTAAFGANYASWAPASSQMGLVNSGGYYRLGKLSLALGGRYCLEQPYELVSGVSKVLGTFTPKEFTLGAGVAYQIMDPLAVGVSLRYISSELAESARGSAVAADITATYSVGGLLAAVGVSNLGSKISYGGQGNALPTTAKAGVSYRLGGLVAGVEADYLLSGGLMAGAGVEYGFANLAFVRAGYHYGSGSALPSFLSLGAGVHFKGVRLDVSWLTASEALGNTLSLGLSYGF